MSTIALDQLHSQNPDGNANQGPAHDFRLPPKCRRCGQHDAELRHCKRNDGVAWACRPCNRIIGNWIPHRLLTGLDLAALPDWIRR